jgi:hypothetical protein
MEHCELPMELGKQDGRKPPVRFGEGWKTDVIGLRAPPSLAFPTLLLLWVTSPRERCTISGNSAITSECALVHVVNFDEPDSRSAVLSRQEGGEGAGWK